MLKAVCEECRIGENQGAGCIDFNQEDPIEILKDATDGSLADVVIDAVGVDAVAPAQRPAAKQAKEFKDEFARSCRNRSSNKSTVALKV